MQIWPLQIKEKRFLHFLFPQDINSSWNIFKNTRTADVYKESRFPSIEWSPSLRWQKLTRCTFKLKSWNWLKKKKECYRCNYKQIWRAFSCLNICKKKWPSRAEKKSVKIIMSSRLPCYTQSNLWDYFQERLQLSLRYIQHLKRLF